MSCSPIVHCHFVLHFYERIKRWWRNAACIAYDVVLLPCCMIKSTSAGICKVISHLFVHTLNTVYSRGPRTTSKNNDILERIQHIFTRLIRSENAETDMERLDKLNLWTLEERRNRSDLIEVFKMANSSNWTLTIEHVVIHLNWSNIDATAKCVVTSSQKELLIVGTCWIKSQHLQSLWMVSSQN